MRRGLAGLGRLAQGGVGRGGRGRVPPANPRAAHTWGGAGPPFDWAAWQCGTLRKTSHPWRGEGGLVMVRGGTGGRREGWRGRRALVGRASVLWCCRLRGARAIGEYKHSEVTGRGRGGAVWGWERGWGACCATCANLHADCTAPQKPRVVVVVVVVSTSQTSTTRSRGAHKGTRAALRRGGVMPARAAPVARG